MEEETRPLKREDEVQTDLIEHLIVLAKHKWLIIGITLGSAVLTAISGLFMPPIYLAETKFFSPSQSPSLSSPVLNQKDSASTLLGVGKSPNYLYAELVKSKPVRDRIIDRFGLMKLYGSKKRQNARAALLKHIKLRLDDKSGVITLGVEDRDPQRAAAMANAFIEELRNLNSEFTFTAASQSSLFLEAQLGEAKESLAKAQDAMKAFKEQTGAVKIDAQASAAIAGIAQLRAQIAALEVQLKVMRTYSAAQNPDIQSTEEELRWMQEQLKRLESKGANVMIPAGNTPSASTEYVYRLRELIFNETLVELLQDQYQSAKLDADAIVIQVIEKAEPPERWTKPKKKLMVILGMFVGLIIAIFAAFIFEFMERASHDPENRERMETLRKHLFHT